MWEMSRGRKLNWKNCYWHLNFLHILFFQHENFGPCITLCSHDLHPLLQMRPKLGSSLKVIKDSYRRRETATAAMLSSIWSSLGVRDALSCGNTGVREGVFSLSSCHPASMMHAKVRKPFTVRPILSVVWKNVISLHGSSSKQFSVIGLIFLIGISLCRAFHKGFPVVCFTRTSRNLATVDAVCWPEYRLTWQVDWCSVTVPKQQAAGHERCYLLKVWLNLVLFLIYC